MGNDKSAKPVSPTSGPPEVDDVDEHSDDKVLGDDELAQDRETVVSIEDREAHDRVTAVPALPTEQYVAQIMREADHVERSVDEKAPVASTADGSTDATGTPSRHVPSLGPLELDDLDLGPEDDLDLGLPPGTNPRSDPPQLPSDPPDSGVPDSVTSTAEASPRSDMQYRYAMGDFSGALSIAEQLLAVDPSDDEAERYASSCRTVLIEMYTSRLGALDSIITARVPSEKVTWLSLDHRAGFVLSLIDNDSTLETLLDISGMAQLDTLKILVELLDQGVISLSHPKG